MARSVDGLLIVQYDWHKSSNSANILGCNQTRGLDKILMSARAATAEPPHAHDVHEFAFVMQAFAAQGRSPMCLLAT
jgi:hypothetical protein